MREIELKILEIDRERAVSTLLSLGAVMTFDDEIHALYYDMPGQSLKERHTTLRLRREGAGTVLAVKHDICDDRAKVREEREVAVSDFHGMRAILEALGFSIWLEMKKHRTSYQLAGLHFEFDRYQHAYAFIPEFLEIEGPSVDAIYRYAGLLGYAEGDCRPWDAVQLAAHYAVRP